MPYIQLTSHLTLHADPIDPLHPATKQYVDAKAGAVTGSLFTLGILPIAKLPPLTGDVVSVAGSNVLTLADSTAPANTYYSITVDSKGRVVAGSTSNAVQGGGISWNWVTGEPNTLGGFGISDIISKTGGTVAGSMSSSVTGTQPLHAVTRAQSDAAVSAVTFSGAATGDVIRISSLSTPAGHLRANGGVLSQLTYAALYAIIGDNYSLVTGYMGQPWRQQHPRLIGSPSYALTWVNDSPLGLTRANAQVVVTKDKVFILGGVDENGTVVNTVNSATLNVDGSISAFSVTASIATAVEKAQAILVKNRVYLFGGNNDSGIALTTVQYATVDQNTGALGVWTNTTALPSALKDSQAVVIGKYIYLIGGSNNSGAVATVYRNTVNSDGTLNAWTTETALPAAVNGPQAIVTTRFVYLVGGKVGNDASNSVSTVYRAAINGDGTLGVWVTDTPLSFTIYGSQVLTGGNKVYLIGGRHLTINDTFSTVYSAAINADGTLGVFTAAAGALPAATYLAQVFTTNDRVYLVGGAQGSVNMNFLFRANWDANGTNDYVSQITDHPQLTGQFKLPDFTSLETDNLYYYVKY